MSSDGSSSHSGYSPKRLSKPNQRLITVDTHAQDQQKRNKKREDDAIRKRKSRENSTNAEREREKRRVEHLSPERRGARLVENLSPQRRDARNANQRV